MRIKLYHFVYLVVLVFLASCSKPNNYSNISNEVIKEWDTRLLASNQNHPTPGIADSARLQFRVLSDNSIRFDVFVDSLNVAGDRITKVELRLGDPLTDGDLLLDLNPRLSGWYASGGFDNLRQTFIDTLTNESIAKYVTVITANAPNGLVRGQLGPKVVYSKNIGLSGANVVPNVSTTTTGMAHIRITEDLKLYSKINITNPDPADPVTSATLNQGAAGSNGPVILTLASAASDFNVAKTTTLTPDLYSSLLAGSSYVIVNSATRSTGKLRGQFK